MSGRPVIVIGNGKPQILTCSKCLKDCHDIAIERDRQLKEAQAEIAGAIKLCGEHSITAAEGLYASLAISVGRLVDQIERKDKLIEQMREALAWVNDVSCSFPGFYFERGEDSDGNECESISECVGAALEAIKKE